MAARLINPNAPPPEEAGFKGPAGLGWRMRSITDPSIRGQIDE
jgi:hypothetical protein